MYKNNCSFLGLTKGSCKFITSDFPIGKSSHANPQLFLYETVSLHYDQPITDDKNF